MVNERTSNIIKNDLFAIHLENWSRLGEIQLYSLELIKALDKA